MIDLSRPSRYALRRSLLAGVLAVAGCAVSRPGTRTAFTQTAARGPAAPARLASQPPAGWTLATMEHVDLWLHGYAMLTSDTGHVPFFARGYKQEVTALKRQRNVYTTLDANQATLSQRFAANPALANGQFLAMYFNSFPEIVYATDAFFTTNGNPRMARDPQLAEHIAMLASIFRSQADRNWLRLFVQSLQDENTKFFNAYWTSEQHERGAAFSAVSELWAKAYPKLSRFLNNTQQPNGQFVLAITLGGEGRTINDSKQSNMIAVGFPKTAEAAPEALFTFVHEAVGQLATEAISDNTTPAEQRSGVTSGYVGNGAVRGGAILLQRVLPELVPDYMRFYLRTLGRTPSAADPAAAFAEAFPLPPVILNGLTRQIDVVLGGI